MNEKVLVITMSNGSKFAVKGTQEEIRKSILNCCSKLITLDFIHGTEKIDLMLSQISNFEYMDKAILERMSGSNKFIMPRENN